MVDEVFFRFWDKAKIRSQRAVHLISPLRDSFP